MAPKSKYYDGESKDKSAPFSGSDNMGGVFSSQDSRKGVEQSHSGDTGDYPDTIDHVDAEMKKNSNWTKDK